MYFLPLLFVDICCSALLCSLPWLQVVFIILWISHSHCTYNGVRPRNSLFGFQFLGDALIHGYFIFYIFLNLLILYKMHIKLVRLASNMVTTVLFQLQQHRLYRSFFIWFFSFFPYCFSSLYGCQHKGQCRDWESIHATPVDTQIITNCNHWLIFSILIVTHWVEGTLISVVLGEI